MEDKPTTQPDKKLNLKIDEVLELKIYFMIARQQDIKIPNEKVVASLAYNLEGALEKAREEAKGLNLAYHGQNIPVKDLIEKIYLEGVISPITTEPSSEITKPDMTKQQFLFNLLLVADTFVADKEEKDELKRLLSKIKINEKESQTK